MRMVALVGVVEAREEIHDRGLARARRPDEGGNAALPRVEADVVEDVFAAFVAEGHLLEFDLPADRAAGACDDDGPIRRLFGLVHYLEDALGAREGRLQRIVGVGEIVEGPRELARVGDEARDDADGDEALDGEDAAHGGHRSKAQVVDDVHEGHDEARPDLRPSPDGF